MSMDTTEGGEAAPVARGPTMDTASMTQEKHIAYAMEMSGQTGDKSVRIKNYWNLMNKIFKHKQILFQIVSIRTLCRHLIPYKFYTSEQDV